MRRKRFMIFFLVLALLLLQGCSVRYSGSPQVPAGTKAVVLVVVDQLGTFPYAEYNPVAGFVELSRRAAYYPTARYPYLHPETCPGHATISTGTYPWKHGIVENRWEDPQTGKETYCVADSRYERSPRWLERPALGDLLKKRGYDVRVVSVSGKDRAAIMLGGHRRDYVAWYDRDDGQFTTSAYYRELPKAVVAFNEEEPWKPYFFTHWQVSPTIALPYGFSLEPDREFFSAVGSGPAVDDLSFEVFRRLVAAVNAESPEAFHVLAISFSALDHVGHRYGAWSPHYRSALHNVDRLLAQLLRLLDETYGREEYVLALTGDHGAFPIEKPAHRRVSGEEVSCVRSGKSCGGVRERVCYDQLSAHSSWYQQARHSFFSGRSAACVQIYADTLVPHAGEGTTHVTPHPVDTDVPLWLIGPAPGLRNEIVSPAAIVPTVLELLGESGSTEFDARSLHSASGSMPHSSLTASPLSSVHP